LENFKLQLLRRYGYDILINRFEPLLRNIIINEVLLYSYGIKNWKNEIPEGVIENLKEDKEIDINDIEIHNFFEEVYLWGLKEIAIYSDHYKYLKILTEELNKVKFIEYMDELNEIRKKIAHAKSTFSRLDLDMLIYNIKQICQGKIAEDLIKYINNESYKLADEIPLTFFSDYFIPNNLPIEEYDLDGGFVGRREEIKKIKKLLYSDLDRIITITGAGGVGKTAVALKTSYSLLSDEKGEFDAIIWFSAKETKLTADQGIVEIESDIESCEQLVYDILGIIDKSSLELYKKTKMAFEKYQEHLYDIFSSQKCLLIIDNLETIYDQKTIIFIKDIPRPSKVLITSRKGLGEIERRYELPDFRENDAILLFRIISRERNRTDLLRLDNEIIKDLVKRVKYYPLLIKWSIGKVCLGKDIQDAFSEIYSGKSEIAQFVFDDVFELLTDESKACLYGMIIYGDKPISKHFLKYLTNLDDEAFEDAIRELIITSFVYPESSSQTGQLITNYSMLSLTRGFIQNKLDEDKKKSLEIRLRYYELSRQIQEHEKSQKAYDQSFFSLGVKSDEEKIAYNYVKTAKNFFQDKNNEKAKEYFENAIKVAPKFVYALAEYAKFEFYCHHIEDSNKLFNLAIEADPENFHSFFSYGISLKKQNKIQDAISILEKAKELNPNYLPIYNELGRVYTFNGDFEKANIQFEKAKKQDKYPNYRHKFFTLQYQADNYKRWAESFFIREDYQRGIDKLMSALSIIEIANQIRPGDFKIKRTEKQICREIAIKLCQFDRFEESVPFFDRCFEKIELKDGGILRSDREMALAYYYYALYGFKKSKIHINEVLIYIKKARATTTDKRYLEKIKELEKKIENKLKINSSELKIGKIIWFNKYKKYGFIESEDESFFFPINSFNKFIAEDELITLEGKNVSFTAIENPKKKGKFMAININLEEDN